MSEARVTITSTALYSEVISAIVSKSELCFYSLEGLYFCALKQKILVTRVQTCLFNILIDKFKQKEFLFTLDLQLIIYRIEMRNSTSSGLQL